MDFLNIGIVVGLIILVPLLLIIWYARSVSHTGSHKESKKGKDSHDPHHDHPPKKSGGIVEKWFWNLVKLAFAIWITSSIIGLFTNRPKPPPPKVYKPEEVLYVLDMRDENGNLVNFEGEVVSEPEKYFAITVKGLDYFEGWYPRVNSMKPNESRLIFSQSFGGSVGTWKDIDGRSKKVKKQGFVQILRDLEYVPGKIGSIRGIFWKEGLDHSTRSGSFNFILHPPGRIDVTRTLAYYD